MDHSVLNLEIQTFDFRMDAETFQLTNSLSASRAARSGQISTNWAVFPWRVSWFSNDDVDKVRLTFFLQPLFLNNFPQIQISLQMSLLFGSLVDPFLVSPLPGLAFAHLEALIII